MARPVVELVDGWPVEDVGRLRHAITIQRQAVASPPAVDAAGPVMAWTDFLTGVMAAMEVMPGREVIRSGQVTSQLYVTVTMWYQPGVSSNMRVVGDNGSVYSILAVENVAEMEVVLQLRCLGLGAAE